MYKISKNMTGKMEGINTLNTSPLNNEFCKKMSTNAGNICESCYSIRMLKTFRQNANGKFEQNGQILSEIEIPLALHPTLNSAFFRGHAHGELINVTHFINFVFLAIKNPHCTIALWTKRTNIVRKGIAELENRGIELPDNLILVYSNPKLDSIRTNPPPNFHKIFNVVTSESPEYHVNCGGKKCIDCLTCYKKDKTNVMIEVVKTQGTHNTKAYKKQRDSSKNSD